MNYDDFLIRYGRQFEVSKKKEGMKTCFSALKVYWGCLPMSEGVPDEMDKKTTLLVLDTFVSGYMMRMNDEQNL